MGRATTMAPRPLLTLGQCIGLAFAALACVLIVLLSVFYAGSRRTILLASEQLMRQTSRSPTAWHFGAPDRMSFTAMGDGVNLASRLEGLGKQYGVAVLVSATVARDAGCDFWLRRLDRVAVQGNAPERQAPGHERERWGALTPRVLTRDLITRSDRARLRTEVPP